MILVGFGPIFLVGAAIWLWRKSVDRARKRTPLTRDLLRSPGESLREQIEDASWDVAAYIAFAPLLPMSLYAAYVSDAAFTGKFPPLWVGLLFLFAAITTLAWLILKLWRVLARRRQLAVGYEAELAVGQELNQLAHKGFHVFHDIPAKGFNVDHVVVGPEGVFAVETKGRTKRTNQSDPGAESRVNYDGEYLDFPKWRTKAPMDQAARQAKWLADWLSSAVGDPVLVTPVVILAGWYVRRTAKPRVAVIGSGEIHQYFPKIEPRHRLSDQTISRIVHQLDQRCRDIEPQAYKQPEMNGVRS